MSARFAQPIASTGTIVAAGCFAAALVSGPGYQIGLWSYRIGFIILRWAAYCAIGAAFVALIGSVGGFANDDRRAAWIGAAGLAVALVLIVPAWELEQTAKHAPRIHDITTDTADPPRFVALLPARQKAPNGAEYAGEKIAREQRAAYPDIQPLIVNDPPQQAFDRALAAARKLGWEIVASVPTEGRIEATDATRWFHFKDDLVIRITPTTSGTRLDIRSASRLGRGDLGTNARRVRKFFEALRDVQRS